MIELSEPSGVSEEKHQGDTPVVPRKPEGKRDTGSYQELAAQIGSSVQEAREVESFTDYVNIILNEYVPKLLQNPDSYDELEERLISLMASEQITVTGPRSQDYRTIMSLMRQAYIKFAKQQTIPEADLQSAVREWKSRRSTEPQKDDPRIDNPQ